MINKDISNKLYLLSLFMINVKRVPYKINIGIGLYGIYLRVQGFNRPEYGM
jgi:hypothetical protein